MNKFFKKHKIALFILLIIIFLSLTVLIGSQKRSSSNPIVTISPSPEITNITKNGFYSGIKSVFQNNKEKYKGELSESNQLSVWWISKDNLNIINDNSTGIEFFSFKYEPDNSGFKEIAQSIGKEIDKTMKENGYKLNLQNSSKSINDDQFYDYVQAYEKGSTKAVFTASPDYGTTSNEIPMHYTFSFVFTNDFDKNYQQQSPYLKDLNIKYDIIHIQKKIGDFVSINVNARRTGYYTIAKLINGKWTELHSGQDIPSCEITKKYSVPKEISSCYSDENQ